MTTDWTVRRASWPDDEEAIARVRIRVFIEEQQVPAELEWDGLDALCTQVLALGANGEAIGTGRLCPGGHIGRMAVLEDHRGRGIGSAVLTELLAAAGEQALASVYLNAQTGAIPFYRHFGFQAEGEEFMDAGIPHRRMILML